MDINSLKIIALQKVALELLGKYKESETMVIEERSGRIDDDIAALSNECLRYEKLIEDIEGAQYEYN